MVPCVSKWGGLQPCNVGRSHTVTQRLSTLGAISSMFSIMKSVLCYIVFYVNGHKDK